MHHKNYSFIHVVVEVMSERTNASDSYGKHCACVWWECAEKRGQSCIEKGTKI